MADRYKVGLRFCSTCRRWKKYSPEVIHCLECGRMLRASPRTRKFKEVVNAGITRY